MRLGIFGGTFDPVHYGHLLLAEQCREQCQLDEVRFMPAGIPPHKTDVKISSGKDRVEMLRLAIAGQESFTIDERELARSGPSYTYETLEELREEDSQRELFLIIGADSLRDFPIWRHPQRILAAAQLAVVNRGGEPMPQLDELISLMGPEVATRTHLVTIPGLELASSDIRKRAASGESIRYMTPRAVECYIEAQQLYR
ncbi:Nicotinate-nucleotide adenylyltransferase [Symmachiella dynata]|uniref:Probable nicotinate-nucleotide adenylyltransferase n=1 Tax=Symmachiella dynata TaxID=2527995 RepID=A0A517ZU09_9PLAN|nr:nicotinate-nucleotide adenylyltransferase [Symmachiella dynata]QDU45940.1 Nicotinate-nucleotide adenylyltransferase [Symmachiella dynata]